MKKAILVDRLIACFVEIKQCRGGAMVSKELQQATMEKAGGLSALGMATCVRWLKELEQELITHRKLRESYSPAVWERFRHMGCTEWDVRRAKERKIYDLWKARPSILR